MNPSTLVSSQSATHPPSGFMRDAFPIVSCISWVEPTPKPTRASGGVLVRRPALCDENFPCGQFSVKTPSHATLQYPAAVCKYRMCGCLSEIGGASSGFADAGSRTPSRNSARRLARISVDLPAIGSHFGGHTAALWRAWDVKTPCPRLWQPRRTRIVVAGQWAGHLARVCL